MSRPAFAREITASTPPAQPRRAKRGAAAALLVATALIALAGTAPGAEPIETVLEPVHAVVISAPVDGVIEDIAVDEGDAVAVGSVVVKFVRASEELQVERASEVLRKRKFDAAGVDQLFKDQMTSETEKLEKEIERRVAEIDLAQAIEQRDLRILKSVHNGIVTRKHRERGEYVERGAPLLELIDQRELDARCYLPPEQALALEVGDPVWVRIPLLNASVRGTVIFVDPLIDESSGLMRVRARLDNSDGTFRAGLRGWVSFGEMEPPTWP